MTERTTRLSLIVATVLGIIVTSAVVWMYLDKVKGCLNVDSAHVVALTVQGMLRRGESIDTQSTDSAIANLINQGVINGIVRGNAGLNIWGKRFEIEVLQDGSVVCRSPGLLGLIGSAEHKAYAWIGHR
jgi:hypothetical protein